MNLVGSFSDSLTFDEAVARYPRMYGAGVRHPLRTLALLTVVGSVASILLITLIVAVAAGHL